MLIYGFLFGKTQIIYIKSEESNTLQVLQTPETLQWSGFKADVLLVALILVAGADVPA